MPLTAANPPQFRATFPQPPRFCPPNQPASNPPTPVSGEPQYLSIRYTERLAEAGIEPSVGSVGDSYDNALAESVIGLYKTEVIDRRGPWRHAEAVEFATLDWVDWFNNRRLLSSIGDVPPVEYEEQYYQAQNAPATGAGVN